MDNKYKAQVNEFNKLWHRMLIESNYEDLELRYPNMSKLSKTEIAVIRIISEKEDVIIKDILDVLNMPKSTLTSIINRLENKDIIVRAISTRDRRSYKLELTEKGKMIQDEHVKFEEEVYGRVMSSLDTYEERETLLKLTRKIVRNIKGKEE